MSNKENKIKDALEFYGKNLGLTFQIADDTLDYNSDLNIFGKETGNDFYEGKITLPIILLCQKIKKDEKLEIKEFFLQIAFKISGLTNLFQSCVPIGSHFKIYSAPMIANI